jgi:hypothetical protein
MSTELLTNVEIGRYFRATRKGIRFARDGADAVTVSADRKLTSGC